MIDFIAVFITFFAVIDPIGTVPIFVAVTEKYDAKTKRYIALLAASASAGVLIFFVVIGEIILKALSISLPAFQISGGIVLFLFALSMIFGDSKPEEELKLLAKTDRETAIYPIAVPSIASPGAILTAVLLTENAIFSIWEQLQTALVMLSVLIVVYILMLLSGYISKVIGSSGANVISRVMGLILSAIATKNILTGFTEYYKLVSM
ncbi:MAG: MarC family protein [Pseudoalteromonas sp.]